MIYRPFEDKSLIDNRFHYSNSKHLMTHGLIGAFDHGVLVGFVSYDLIDEETAIILFIEVIEGYRRKKIGTNLIKALYKSNILDGNIDIDVFAESYEGFSLFSHLVSKGILPENTVIGGGFIGPNNK